MEVLTLAALLAVILLLAFFRSSLWGWLLAAAVFIPIVAIQHRISANSFEFVIIALALLIVVLGVPMIRRTLVSGPLLGWFRRVSPRISAAGQQRLEAGTVGWEAELFGGSPDWHKLLALPSPALRAAERAFLQNETGQLCALLDDWDVRVRQDLPPQAWRFIREKGFLGMTIPVEYGGLGFSAQLHAAVTAKIASRCAAGALTVATASALARLLLLYGMPEQKEKYLPGLARGEDVPCFAPIASPQDSFGAAIADRGVVCRDEQGMLGVQLTWEKRCVALAPVATLIGVMFDLHDPERLLGGEREPGATFALVPADAAGVEIGRRHASLDAAFQYGPTSGRGVFVPLDRIVGGEDGIGSGWRMLMECRAAGCAVGLAAVAVGNGRSAARSGGAYCRVSGQSARPGEGATLAEETLARIGGNLYAMDAVQRFTALAVDGGERPAAVSAIVRQHCAERGRAIAADAMELYGGKAVCLGPDNRQAGGYLQAPLGAALEGGDVHGGFVFRLAAARAHPYAMREARAADDGDEAQAVRDFDAALLGHISFALSNAVRVFVFGLTGGHGIPVRAENPVRRHLQQLTRYSAAFALVADAAMLTAGGRLGRPDSLRARLGDALGQMVLGCAVIKRFEDEGRRMEDLPLLRWAMQDALHRTQTALDGALRDFPQRPLAWLLRVLVFPLGRHAAPPAGRLQQEVAALLTRPGAARDRLTAGTYSPEDENDPLGALEAALRSALECEALRAKVEAARQAGRLQAPDELARIAEARDAGIIGTDDALLLERDHALRRKVGAIDDFAPEGPARTH